MPLLASEKMTPRGQSPLERQEVYDRAANSIRAIAEFSNLDLVFTLSERIASAPALGYGARIERALVERNDGSRLLCLFGYGHVPNQMQRRSPSCLPPNDVTVLIAVLDSDD
jgi:hypothetical protein